MSQVYVGYKLKDPSIFEEWVGRAKKVAAENAYQIYKKYLLELLREELAQDNCDIFETIARKHQEVMKEYKDNYTNSMYAFCDFTVELIIYMHENNIYFIPLPSDRGFMQTVWDFLEDDEDLESYGYWDNVDMPDDMDQDEWDQRKKVWEPILDDNNFPYLVLPITDVYALYRVFDYLRLFNEIKEGV